MTSSNTAHSDTAEVALRTPLYDLHLELGGRMVPFAGYELPVQYELGVLKEHLFTREKAGLFDVSHMGQAMLRGKDGAAVDTALERLVPGNLQALKPGALRYSMLLNDDGGILDDLMITRHAFEDNTLYLVVNAACKEADFALIEETLASEAELTRHPERGLLALQGPKAATVLSALAPAAADLAFMQAGAIEIGGIPCHVSRSGYTGEDGYEISVPGDRAEALARMLLESDDVAPIGLGARDSLRLEAGLCLYGSDIDETTSPIEAGLGWAIGKARRERADFPGAARILKEIAEGPSRRRVGIRPEGRAPVRHGAEILDDDGRQIGVVTSGGFGPSVGGPLAMGYVEAGAAAPGTSLGVVVRGKVLPAAVAEMPFVPHRYYRKSN